jgi:hypothetical protein
MIGNGVVLVGKASDIEGVTKMVNTNSQIQ